MNRNFFGVALTLQIGRVVSRQKSYSRHSLALEHVRNPRTSCRSLRSFQTLLNPLCKVEPGRGRWVVWLRVVVVCSSGSSDSSEVQPGVCMLVRGQSRGGRRFFFAQRFKSLLSPRLFRLSRIPGDYRLRTAFGRDMRWLVVENRCRPSMQPTMAVRAGPACRKSEFHLFYSVVDAMRSGGCVVMRAGAMKLRRGRLREDRLAVRGGRPGLLGEDCCGDGGMRGQRSGRVFGLCCSAI